MRPRTAGIVAAVCLLGVGVACAPTPTHPTTTTTVTTTTLDSTPPAPPTVAPDLTPATDTGISNTDNVTATTTPDFQGSCTDGDTVSIVVDDIPTVSAVCTGSHYQITAGMSAGTHAITSTFTDPAGNTSSPSPVLTVTIDTTLLTGVQDTTAPTLVSLVTSPASVDTSTGPATIHATARITDDLSGVTSAGLVFISPSGSHSLNVPLTCGLTGHPVDFTSGDCTAQMPQYSEIGNWTFNYAYVGDAANNFQYLYTADLTAAGVPIPGPIANGH